MLIPSPPHLDFERLAAPISPESPCGESLRWEPVWDELSNLRKSRKDPLDDSADQAPDWDQVVRQATEVLATRTKDLLIAGWLTEALLRTAGFAGLRDGIKLIRQLCERFWDQLHPLPEGDLSVRAAPLAWLMSHDGGARLPATIREAPIAPMAAGAVMNWTFWNQRRAAPQGKDEKEDAYKKRLAEAEQKRSQFDSSVETAPIVYYQTLLADIDSGVAELDALTVILDQRLADQAPSSTEFKKSIAEIRVFVYDVLKRRGGLPAAAATEAPAEQAMSVNGSADDTKSNNNHAGPPRSRGEAIARLSEAAQYFSDAEPHSPVAYLVRRAIRWADMPFEEVLGELVKDDKLVKQIGETLGIPSK